MPSPHAWTKNTSGRVECSKCKIYLIEAEALGTAHYCEVEDKLPLDGLKILIDHIAQCPASEYKKLGRESIPIFVLRVTEKEKEFLVKASRYFIGAENEGSSSSNNQ